MCYLFVPTQMISVVVLTFQDNTRGSRVPLERIYNMYMEYREDRDFVGMDMCRKFLEMGFTQLADTPTMQTVRSMTQREM